jgi:hypothetical protein
MERKGLTISLCLRLILRSYSSSLSPGRWDPEDFFGDDAG